MDKLIIRKELRQLYLISFIEGGVVMVTELAGAKILTPFFGASLYSWASTLSITLCALMCGYYYGGYVTTKPSFASPGKITWVFFISGLMVLIMPSLGHFIMQKTISFPFFTGLIISEFCFLFIPVFLMGMISPMIIFQITKKAEHSGRSAGNIYAISTSGGILFTLVFGFLIIPYYGISTPVRLLGLAVCLMAMVFLITDKLKTKNTVLPSVVLIMLSVMAFGEKKDKSNSGSTSHLVERSEGLLGELKVIDELSSTPNGQKVSVRVLRTNNVQQNCVFRDLPSQSLMHYVNFTRQLIHILPKKATALLIGLGAGSLYSVLNSQKVEVKSVEIDRRIYDLGMRYFGLPQHDNVITDGRYFINSNSKKYDIILLDVIIGESVPGQLITLESFKKCYQTLTEEGTLIIEHGGVSGFAENSFVPSIAKTLQAAGFFVSILNPLANKTHGDIMFVATKKKLDVTKINILDDVLIKGGALANYALPLSVFNTSQAGIFTDDRNNIDILLKAHYFKVRNGIRKELSKTKYRSM